jgi:hypothetical protein
MLPIVATLSTIVLLAIFSARHFSGVRAALICVGLFVTMPLVWTSVRDASPQLVLLPFVTAWLVTFNEYLKSQKAYWLPMAGASLALMVYLHLVGVVMAPVYVAISATALLVRREPAVRLVAFAAGFGMVAAPWAVMMLRDPQALTASIQDYGLYDANRFNVLQGGRELTSWIGLTVRSEVYWDYFNPALWFLGKDGSLASVIRPQVFLLPLAIPLYRALVGYVRRPQPAMDWIVLAGFAAAPVAAALIAQPSTAGRLVLILPVAAILATMGLSRHA